MPARPSAVRKSIQARYASLTGQQQRAADYVLSHQRTAFAMSVQDLARAAKVSEATLVRFARRLGFEGYLELRAALTDEAKRDLLPEDRFAFEEPSSDPRSTVAKVARQDVENVNRTIEEIDPKELRRFVELLRDAESVVTVGLGVSAILARFASYSLFRVGIRSEPLLRDLLSVVEQVDRLPEGTVALAFAFPPYTKDTAAALARARARKIPVLLITDAPQSPMVPHATATLYARSENILFTNSISGPVVLINALATELALTDKAKALRARLPESVRKDEYV